MSRVALVCQSDTDPVITYWATPAEAAEAARAFPRCRRDCLGAHSIVYRTDGRWRVLGNRPISRRSA